MKSKILSCILLIVMVFALVGCGDTTQKENDKNGTNNKNTEVSSDNKDYVENEKEQGDESIIKPIIVGKSIEVVEEGCTYYVAATDTTLEAGAEIPTTPGVGDKYETADYKYTYGFEIGDKEINEWNVKAKDKTKTNYGEILYSIAGNKLLYMYRTFEKCESMVESPAIPSGVTTLYWTYFRCFSMVNPPELPDTLVDMYGTFSNCKGLTTAPKIPEGVTRMYRAFCACESLVEAPVLPLSVTNLEEAFDSCKNLKVAPKIPDGVTNMQGTFSDCTSLTQAPAIPASVTGMWGTFARCTSLTGTIVIDANPYANYTYCFLGVDLEGQNITVTGSSKLLEQIKETANE